MATYRPFADVKAANTNPLIAGLFDDALVVDELASFVFGNSVITDVTHVKGEREVSGNQAFVISCDDTIVASAISGAAYAFDLELINQDFEVCDIVDADGMARELDRNLRSASRNIAERISALAVADIEGQITNTGIAAGASFSLADLDTLYGTIKGAKGQTVYFGDIATVNQVIAAMRSELGGISYSEVAGLQVPQYRGVAILTSEFATSGTLSHIDFSAWQGYLNAPAKGTKIAPWLNMKEKGALEGKAREGYRLQSMFTSVLLSTRKAGKLVLP